MKKIIAIVVCFISVFCTTANAASIDELVRPIALYPDPLLKNMLPAATFPDQIIDASLLVTNKVDAKKIKDQSWDNSVKVMATYPGIIKMMSEKIDWTTQLGTAFLNQSKDVLEAIQKQRHSAKNDGALKSDSKQKITVDSHGGGTIIEIQPTNPEVVYIPTTTVVSAGDTDSSESVLTPLVTFGLGMAVGAAMNNDSHYYYSGWGGPAFWYDEAPVNKWLDNRREVWEDYNDRKWDQQDFRQDQRKDRQDFRQDMIDDGNIPSKSQVQDFHTQQADRRAQFNDDQRADFKSKHPDAAQQFQQKAANRGWSSQSASDRRSAFQGFESRSTASSFGSRGAGSRMAAGGFHGGGLRGRR